ncbi:unnamed protein product, partial [Porites lobata]
MANAEPSPLASSREKTNGSKLNRLLIDGGTTELSTTLHSLGLDQAEIDRLKAEGGGEQDYLDVLIEWADSEQDIKTQLKNIQ